MNQDKLGTEEFVDATGTNDLDLEEDIIIENNDHRFDGAIKNLMEYKLFKSSLRKTYEVNFLKLKLNYKYKNWQEVCKDLGIPNVGGNVKKIYLGILEKYTKFTKDKQSYTFCSISSLMVSGMSSYRGTISKTDCIEALLMSIFYEADRNPIALSARGWYRLIGIVSPEWNPYDKEKKKRIAADLIKQAEEYSNVPLTQLESEADVQIFYDLTLNQIGACFNYAFKNLMNKGCVSVDFIHCGYKLTSSEAEILVESYDETKERGKIPDLPYNYFSKHLRKLTPEENVQYLECKAIVREEMRLKDEKAIYLSPRITKEFYDRLERVVLEKMHFQNVNRTMVAYPHSTLCLNVLRDFYDREEVKKFLNIKVQDGFSKRVRTAKTKVLNGEKFLNTEDTKLFEKEDFLQLQKALSKQLLYYDKDDSLNILTLGLEAGLKNGREIFANDQNKKMN